MTCEAPKTSELFKRDDQPMILKAERSGLGLPLANAIVQAHGGTLTIESRPRIRTSVTVSIPRQACA